MKILIIEEDDALATFLQKLFSAEGHEVRTHRSVSSTISEVTAFAPHLLVVDLASSGTAGSEILSRLAREHVGVSVFALTSSVSVGDRVTCLELGADDCMTKPFSFQELMARCRALLRRKPSIRNCVLSNGTLRLNRIDRSVQLRGRAINLTAKEFSLLEQLMLADGRSCSREELLNSVFESTNATSTNIVDVYVTYLRRKLGAATDQMATGHLIETLRGVGYRLAKLNDGFSEMPV